MSTEATRARTERPRLRSILALAIFAAALGSVAAAHYYVLRGFVLAPELGEPWRTLGVAFVPIAFAGLFVGLALERVLAPPWLRIVSWPFALWIGVFWLGFVALLFTDVAFSLMGAASFAPALDLARSRALAAGALVVLASSFGLRGALRLPRVKRVELALAEWPRALEGFRIVQISDIHIGPILGRSFAAALVERVNSLAPDLIAVTGDLVDGAVEKVGGEVEPFAALRARHGAFFVPGNHDFYSGLGGWADRVRALGMRVLRNERVPIGGSDGFDLAGVDDHRGDWREGSTEDLGAALAQRDPRRPVVLLAHDPTTFVKASAAGVALQLSGHTHGGQIWPFGALVRLTTPFVAGHFTRGDSQLYVSRGSGFWGPPMRLFAPSEITEIVLRRRQPSDRL
ncbi:MAG TPA: metallophosphoesterase [Myxococcota bacterium]|nr:metallophosphoesterase [Myxococcota bacterium]